MFCPKCKAEYREGFYKCADCCIDLVVELPSESAPEAVFDDPVEIYSTYQQGEIAFVKSILEGEGIPFFFQGESPLLISMAYARLFVNADEADRVKEILQNLGLLDKE
ncbi:MAG: hypothetical protein AB2L12_03270 [Smithellaceae bacterium]